MVSGAAKYLDATLTAWRAETGSRFAVSLSFLVPGLTLDRAAPGAGGIAVMGRARLRSISIPGSRHSVRRHSSVCPKLCPAGVKKFSKSGNWQFS